VRTFDLIKSVFAFYSTMALCQTTSTKMLSGAPDGSPEMVPATASLCNVDVQNEKQPLAETGQCSYLESFTKRSSKGLLERQTQKKEEPAALPQLAMPGTQKKMAEPASFTFRAMEPKQQPPATADSSQEAETPAPGTEDTRERGAGPESTQVVEERVGGEKSTSGDEGPPRNLFPFNSEERVPRSHSAKETDLCAGAPAAQRKKEERLAKRKSFTCMSWQPASTPGKERDERGARLAWQDGLRENTRKEDEELVVTVRNRKRFSWYLKKDEPSRPRMQRGEVERKRPDSGNSSRSISSEEQQIDHPKAREKKRGITLPTSTSLLRSLGKANGSPSGSSPGNGQLHNSDKTKRLSWMVPKKFLPRSMKKGDPEKATAFAVEDLGGIYVEDGDDVQNEEQGMGWMQVGDLQAALEEEARKYQLEQEEAALSSQTRERRRSLSDGETCGTPAKPSMKSSAERKKKRLSWGKNSEFQIDTHTIEPSPGPREVKNTKRLSWMFGPKKKGFTQDAIETEKEERNKHNVRKIFY